MTNNVCVHLPRKEENLARDILKELRTINYNLDRLCRIDESYIVEHRNNTIDEITKETENYCNKIQEYEKRLKDLIFKGGKDYGDPT